MSENQSNSTEEHSKFKSDLRGLNAFMNGYDYEPPVSESRSTDSPDELTNIRSEDHVVYTNPQGD